MKTTLELPDSLVKEIKLRAVRRGQKLKDAVAELLHKGLAASDEGDAAEPRPVIKRDKKTGLPTIECKRTPSADEQLTPKRVAEILLAQEIDWYGPGR